MSETTCSVCKETFPESQLFYGDNGMICAGCEGDAQVKAGFANGYKASGTAAFTAGMVTWVFNPLFIMTAIAVFGGIQTLTYKKRLAPEDQASLDGMTWPSALAVAGIAIAAMRFVLGFLLNLGGL